MESLFEYIYYGNGYVKLLGKVIVSKKYLLAKKYLFWKSSSSEDLPASKMYMF